MHSSSVPELSRFFGIVIRMLVEAGGHHHRRTSTITIRSMRPFAVDTIECLEGSLPKAPQRLVEAWAEIHRAELQHDWELLQMGQPPGQDRTIEVDRCAIPSTGVTRFEIVGPCTLAVPFADGLEQRIDFTPVLHGALFGPLQTRRRFTTGLIWLGSWPCGRVPRAAHSQHVRASTTM
jgi:hypothetical protein